jgi:DNA replication protein DnaC
MSRAVQGRTLDHFGMLILDDVGYVQQSPEKAKILFTFLAERRGRRSDARPPMERSSVEPAARSVVNTRDAEETFAYVIMLSANKLLEKSEDLVCGREHPGAFARQRKPA